LYNAINNSTVLLIATLFCRQQLQLVCTQFTILQQAVTVQ